jgi:hypothetical protein
MVAGAHGCIAGYTGLDTSALNVCDGCRLDVHYDNRVDCHPKFFKNYYLATQLLTFIYKCFPSIAISRFRVM